MAKKDTEVEPARMGRPPKWTDPLELETAIVEYFEACDQANLSENRASWRPYTVEGLCEVLGCTRETLHLYEREHADFSDAIREAKLKIGRHKTERAMCGVYNAQFAMFDLKNNHGYRDKTEHEISGELGHREIPPSVEEARAVLRESGLDT